MQSLDRSFWAIFLSMAIIGTITWLAIFEHNYHPRIYRYSEEWKHFKGSCLRRSISLA